MRIFGYWIGKKDKTIYNIINRYKWSPIYNNHLGKYNCLIHLSQKDNIKSDIYYFLADSYIKYTWNSNYGIKLLDRSFKKVIDLNKVSIPDELREFIDRLGYLKDEYVKYLNRSK